MVRATEELEAVAPLIAHQIKGYEDALDIVERPSVGLLAAPVRTCTMIHQFLGYTLFSFTQRRGAKIRVRCERVTPSTLTVDVVADQAWPPVDEVRASSMLSSLNQLAHDLGGEIVTGGEMRGSGKPSSNVFFRLTVPVPA